MIELVNKLINLKQEAFTFDLMIISSKFSFGIADA
jgi:hypothetical protein